MAQIQWKDRYNINYKEIDEQHRILLDILNQMADLLAHEPDEEKATALFHRLCQYALNHFATEESYMEAAGYPGLVGHRALHGFFIDRLLELNQSYDSTDPKLLEESLEFVKGWYLNHIIQVDQEYVPTLKAFRSKAEIKGVLFDFGSVIGCMDERPFLEAISALSGKTPEDLAPLIGSSSQLGKAYESGAMDSNQFLAAVSDHCGQSIAEAQFRPSYSQVFTPNSAILELIRTLKSTCKVGLIAETGPWRFEAMVQHLEIIPLFDAVSLSWELGTARTALWQDALRKLGIMAEECVYVDSRGALTLAATGNLMHGIAYSNPEMLLIALRRIGIRI